MQKGQVGNVVRSSFKHILYAFQRCKKYENRLGFYKVTKSLKAGTFWDTMYIRKPDCSDGSKC